MSSDNPYSTPLPNESDPNKITARKTSGFVIAICVIFILFGIVNLTVTPCQLGLMFVGQDVLLDIVKQGNDEQQIELVEKQIEHTKKIRTHPTVLIPVFLSILLGLGQLVSSIAGFRRSQFGRSTIPIVAAFAIFVTIVNVVCEFLQPAMEDMPQMDMQNPIAMIGMGIGILIIVGCVVFYGIAIAHSMSNSYKEHFGESTDTMYQP